MNSYQIEIDEIYSLLSYAMVYKYWNEDDRSGRGYNVGCILVNPENEVLDWGINSVNKTGNCTQHAEVRMMTSYLNKEGVYSLNNHSIYPTLEPCAMCGGMMTVAAIRRTVNGQRDYTFSKALERLSYDSELQGGYPPYPRAVISEETPSRYGEILDNAYLQYIKEGNKEIITKFLSTPIAKEIFKRAAESFLTYKVKFESNKSYYEKALVFYDMLPEEPK